MPIPVVCPSGHHMTLPDKQAGKRYRCPLCFNYFVVPTVGSAPPGKPKGKGEPSLPAATRSPNAPVSPPPSPSKPTAAKPAAEEPDTGPAGGLRLVNVGLALHYARLVILLLHVLLMLVALISLVFSWGTAQDSWLIEALEGTTHGL